MSALTATAPPPALSSSAIMPGWTWRTSSEGDLPPATMETRHLFYTLRMIWNHCMPRHMEVGRNVKRWRFSDRHSLQYMREAVVQIGAELFTRDDLAPWMLAELNAMARWLGQVPPRTFIEDGRALMLVQVQR